MEISLCFLWFLFVLPLDETPLCRNENTQYLHLELLTLILLTSKTMEILVILVFIILGWGLDHLRRKNLAMSKRMENMEDFLAGSYKYSFEVGMSVDWHKFFSQINPQKSEKEVSDFIEPFRKDPDSLLSINQIEWEFNTDNIYNFSTLGRKIWRHNQPTEEVQKNVSYEWLGYHGTLFWDQKSYEKHIHLIQDFFQYQNIPEEVTTSFRPFHFILHPEQIGWYSQEKSIDPLETSLLSRMSDETFSEIPFWTFIVTCIEQRHNTFDPDKIINRVRQKRSAYTYDISYFDKIWGFQDSFEMKSGAVKLSVHIDFFNADTPF